MTLSTPLHVPILTPSVRGVSELLRYAVLAGCAASVGVHVGIIPAHVEEGATAEVASFAAASAGLAVLGLLVANARWDAWAPLAAAGVLTAVAGAYLLSRTVGLPGLVGDPESFDLTGLVSLVVEVAGAAAGIALSLRTRKDQQ